MTYTKNTKDNYIFLLVIFLDLVFTVLCCVPQDKYKKSSTMIFKVITIRKSIGRYRAVNPRGQRKVKHNCICQEMYEYTEEAILEGIVEYIQVTWPLIDSGLT